MSDKGKVFFIGAGPGDPELLTIKGKRLIEAADLVLYAGSLVPSEVVACAGPHARIADSASLSLPETHELMKRTTFSGGMVARVHTGDPSIYGAVPEQTRLLERDGIEWEIVPGVTAAFAAAACSGVSFTIPERRQSLIITRQEGRTPVPESERLRTLAAHDTAMAVYLSAGEAESVEAELGAGGMKPETRIVVVYRAGWPDERIIETRLDALAVTVRDAGLKGQTVFLVLPGDEAGHAESRLYDPRFSHGCRSGS